MIAKKVFLALALILAVSAYAEETLDTALQKATIDYAARLDSANAELTSTRERIAAEKAPFLKRMRAAEDRIIAAESEVGRLETFQENGQEQRVKLVKNAELLHRNVAYLASLSQDGLKAYADELAPAENLAVGSQISELQTAFSDTSNGSTVKNSIRAAQFLLGRVAMSLGGYTAAGRATLVDKDAVLDGTFAYLGPQTYFQASGDGAAGLVTQLRGDGAFPVVTPIGEWKAEEAKAFFGHQPASVPSDATAGKALRLRETKGDLWAQVDRGGTVAYVILAVGVVSLILIIQKMFDLARMRVDAPQAVERFLATIGDPAAAQRALANLKQTTRELMSVGLLAQREPRLILEERLEAVLLRQRLYCERRLPLLAVIATAAPLMGLLGTVIGMVRTFALITVFGTGNAGKLASGISEVLVTTELGLLVAIPTLIAHGILAQRISKNLSLQERYALEFATQREARTDAEVVST